MYLCVQKTPTRSTGAHISAGEVHHIRNSLLLDMNPDTNLIQKARAYFPTSFPKSDVAQVFSL